MGLVSLENALRRQRPRGLPYIYKIEPTNICNGTCRLCPTGLGLTGRAKGRMSFDNFRRVIDAIRDVAYVADLSNWGDPLIVPEIYDMIRYAHDRRIWTYISSNLHAFRIDAGDAEKMVRSGLDCLNCSLHAATQGAYEAYQPGKQLAPTLEKIRAIIEPRRRLKSLTPTIQLFFVVTKYNEQEIDAFRILAKDMGCESVLTPASLNLRLAPTEQRPGLKAEWLPTNAAWVAPWYGAGTVPGSSGRTGCKPYPCDWPWWGTVINWDGSVSVCCGDFDPKWEMGNILSQPLRTIWNSKAYLAVRGSFKGAGGLGGEPCRSCCGVLV